jgi:hypothetical protein
MIFGKSIKGQLKPFREHGGVMLEEIDKDIKPI